MPWHWTFPRPALALDLPSILTSTHPISNSIELKDAAQYAFHGVRESVSLQSADFVRNLILASFHDETDSIRMYHRYWLPIER